MPLPTTRTQDLLAALYAGVRERPAWAGFVQRLRADTAADRAGLLIRSHGVMTTRWAVRQADDPVPSAVLEEGPDLFTVSLRPGRVYALAELLDYDSPTRRTEQVAELQELGIGDSRVIKVEAEADCDAWLLVLNARHEFSAADSALLTALAPHLAIAVALARELDIVHRVASSAQTALGRLGIAQAPLAADGRVVTAEGLPGRPGDQSSGPALRIAGRQAAGAARAAIAIAAGARHALVAGETPAAALLVHPPARYDPAISTDIAAIAIQRGQADRALSADLIAELYGLSPREAALAEALCHGERLTDAGTRLGLTVETARNYSKRIYQKTGTSGQADLVRLILGGLAPLG